MRLMVSPTDEQVVQQPRKCLQMHKDAIFVCGGSKSLCYFPKENVWYKLSDMLFQCDSRGNPSQYRGKIYIASQGSNMEDPYLMECYSPAANLWSAFEVATKLTSTAVFKGHLYTSKESVLSHGISRYDPEKNFSYELKKPPTTLSCPCVVTDEQYIYLIGGTSGYFGGYTPLAKTYRFDPSADDHKWEEVASINQARYNAFGAAMNGKVYIAGGYQRKVLSTCEVYNPLTNEWQLMPSLKVPRMSASMVCHEGRLYVLGGVNNLSQVLSVEIFDSEQNEWEKKSVIPVGCFETSKEEKQKNKFKACSARLCKVVIDKLKPLNN